MSYLLLYAVAVYLKCSCKRCVLSFPSRPLHSDEQCPVRGLHQRAAGPERAPPHLGVPLRGGGRLPAVHTCPQAALPGVYVPVVAQPLQVRVQLCRYLVLDYLAMSDGLGRSGFGCSTNRTFENWGFSDGYRTSSDILEPWLLWSRQSCSLDEIVFMKWAIMKLPISGKIRLKVHNPYGGMSKLELHITSFTTKNYVCAQVKSTAKASIFWLLCRELSCSKDLISSWRQF